MPGAGLFGFARSLEFKAASRRALRRKLEKDHEQSVRRMATRLLDPKKPGNLPLKKKDPWRKTPTNPTWQRHCCELTAPKADSLRQAKEGVKKMREETVTLICLRENCLGDELPHNETQEKASCMYAMLRYATIHKHMEF